MKFAKTEIPLIDEQWYWVRDGDRRTYLAQYRESWQGFKVPSDLRRVPLEEITAIERIREPDWE